MKDLYPYKTKLMELTYEEKIKISEWLHDQIDTERADAVKEKAKKVSGQMDSFLNKASSIFKNTFKGTDNQTPDKQ